MVRWLALSPHSPGDGGIFLSLSAWVPSRCSCFFQHFRDTRLGDRWRTYSKVTLHVKVIAMTTSLMFVSDSCFFKQFLICQKSYFLTFQRIQWWHEFTDGVWEPIPDPNNSLLTRPPEEQYLFPQMSFYEPVRGKAVESGYFCDCPSLSINQPLFFCRKQTKKNTHTHCEEKRIEYRKPWWRWRPLKQSKCAEGEQQIAPLWQCPLLCIFVCVHFSL